MTSAKTTGEYAFNPAYEQNQSFNRLVSWLHSQRYKHVVQAVTPIAPLDRPLQVLDLGCGFGRLCDVICQSFDAEYTGVDPQSGFSGQGY